jgi:NTP pyrophosphatase (non-canonical NTP hydrolase)
MTMNHRPAAGLSLYDTAAELSATAADLAAAIDTDEATADLACRAASLLADINAGLGIGTPPGPADLAQIARQLDHDLRANRREAITDANLLDVQALCVAEEAGELVGAYRRWAGKARRPGTRRDLEDEIADVLIVTATFAERAGIDLNEAIARKLTTIYSRGWREEPTQTEALFDAAPYRRNPR